MDSFTYPHGLMKEKSNKIIIHTCIMVMKRNLLP